MAFEFFGANVCKPSFPQKGGTVLQGFQNCWTTGQGLPQVVRHSANPVIQDVADTHVNLIYAPAAVAAATE